MAAYLIFHLFIPGALSQRASAFTKQRGIERRSSRFASAAGRAAVAVGEFGLFIWTVLALAFWLLVITGLFV